MKKFSSPAAHILFFGPNYSDYVPRLLEGIVRFQNERGGYKFSATLLGSEDYLEDFSYPPPWLNQGYSGVITYAGAEAGIVQWLTSGKIPIVNASADLPSKEVPSVHLGDAAFVKFALKHLLKTGVKSIMYTGDSRSSAVHFRDKLMKEELKNRPQHFYQTFHTLEYANHLDGKQVFDSEPELAKRILEAEKPLAISCANDFTAMCICQLCLTLGLRIPDEVTVLGVEDSAIARFHSPTISSIRLPGELIGYEAMKTLDRILHGADPPQTAVLVSPTTIVQRQSTMRTTLQSTDDLSRAIALIKDSACQGLKVAELVQLLHVSRKTLERRFQKEVGRSPGDEIRRIRFEKAKELLASSSLSISQVSQLTGFNRVSTFSAFFRQQAGCSPREYRRENQSVLIER